MWHLPSSITQHSTQHLWCIPKSFQSASSSWQGCPTPTPHVHKGKTRRRKKTKKQQKCGGQKGNHLMPHRREQAGPGSGWATGLPPLMLACWTRAPGSLRGAPALEMLKFHYCDGKITQGPLRWAAFLQSGSSCPPMTQPLPPPNPSCPPNPCLAVHCNFRGSRQIVPSRGYLSSMADMDVLCRVWGWVQPPHPHPHPLLLAASYILLDMIEGCVSCTSLWCMNTPPLRSESYSTSTVNPYCPALSKIFISSSRTLLKYLDSYGIP